MPIEPGTYDLVVLVPTGSGTRSEGGSTVRADSYLQVTVQVDTGIR